MMFKTIKDTMMVPFVEYSIYLTRVLNLQITKTAIRDFYIESFAKQNSLTIYDFQNALKHFQIQTFTAQVSYQKLVQFSAPFFVLVKTNNEERLWVATNQTSAGISLFDPTSHSNALLNPATQDGSDYLALLIDTYNPSFSENNYADALKNEKKAEQNYKRSILVNDKFLTDQECDELLQYCEQNNLFERSRVSYGPNNGGSVISEARTSSSADISDFPKIDNIYCKLKGLLGSDRASLESLNCVKYQINNEFQFHFDSYDGDNRKKTMIIYLNENFSGGETYFRELDLSITPKKGRCIIFENIDEYRNVIPLSLHASLPVESGIKYVIPVFENI